MLAFAWIVSLLHVPVMFYTYRHKELDQVHPIRLVDYTLFVVGIIAWSIVLL